MPLLSLFTDYTNRFDAILDANDITATRKANLFFSTIGPENNKVLKNLCVTQHCLFDSGRQKEKK